MSKWAGKHAGLSYGNAACIIYCRMLQSHKVKALTVPNFSEAGESISPLPACCVNNACPLPDLQNSDQQPTSPSSPNHAPCIRLIRPTLRGHPGSSKGLRAASSMDNMFEESHRERASPAPRPPSRSGARGIPRPSSRSALRPSSRSGTARTDVKTPVPNHAKKQRLSRSAQPSPAHR